MTSYVAKIPDDMIARDLVRMAKVMDRVANRMARAESQRPEMLTKMGELRGAADTAREWAANIQEGSA